MNRRKFLGLLSASGVALAVTPSKGEAERKRARGIKENCKEETEKGRIRRERKDCGETERKAKNTKLREKRGEAEGGRKRAEGI